MSEKKYYVKLKPMDTYLIPDDPAKGGILWIDEFKQPYTKTELAEIMGGAIYKQSISLPFNWLGSAESLKEKLGWEFNKAIDKWEYTNPLIELVPVEDGE